MVEGPSNVFSSFIENLRLANITAFKLTHGRDRPDNSWVGLANLDDDRVVSRFTGIEKLIREQDFPSRLFEGATDDNSFSELIGVRKDTVFLVFLHNSDPICIVALQLRNRLDTRELGTSKDCSPELDDEILHSGYYTLISSMYTNAEYEHLKKLFIHFAFVYASRQTHQSAFVGVSMPLGDGAEFSDCLLSECGLTQFSVQYSSRDLNSKYRNYPDKFFVNNNISSPSYTWGSHFWGRMTNIGNNDMIYKYLTFREYSVDALFRRGVFSKTGNGVNNILDKNFIVPAIQPAEDHEFSLGTMEEGDEFSECGIVTAWKNSKAAVVSQQKVTQCVVEQKVTQCVVEPMCRAPQKSVALVSDDASAKKILKVHNIKVPDGDRYCDTVEMIMREQIYFMNKIPFDLRNISSSNILKNRES
jgi:hypothetical protein